MIYFIFLIIIFFFVIIYDINGITKFKRYSYFFLYFILVLLSAFRFRIGTDSFTYERLFELINPILNIHSSDFATYRTEPIWILYLSILKTFTNDFFIVQFTNAVIVNYAIFKFIKARTQFIFSSIFFYFLIAYLPYNCEFMRQSLAISIFYLFGFKFLIQKKWILYILLTLLCANIHSTVYLAFLFPFFVRIEFTNKNIIITCFLTLIISLVIMLNFAQLGFIFPDGSLISSKIGSYSHWEENKNFNYYIFRLLNMLVSIAILLLLKKYKVNKDYYPFVVIWIVIYLLTNISDIFARLQYIVLGFYILSVSNVFNILLIKVKHTSLIILFYLLIFFTQQYIIYNHQTSNGVRYYSKFFPYYSVFNPKEDPERESLDGSENSINYLIND